MATFPLGLTEGKTRDELAEDYLRCLRSASRWQRIALCLIELAPDSVAKLPLDFRAEVERLIEAYKD